MKNKKVLIFLSIIICLFIIFLMGGNVKAYQEQIYLDDGEYYDDATGLIYKKVSGEIVIIGVRTGVTDLNIPSTIEGMKVTRIENAAFEPLGISTLKQITIPDTVVEIGSFAFNGVENLQKIVLPKNLKYMGGFAFENCKSLKEITVTTNIKSSAWFDGCSKLEKVIFTENVTDFSNLQYIFDNKCYSLKSIYIMTPETVTISKYLKPSNINNATIYCLENSSMHTFCKYYGMNYKLIEIPFLDVNENLWYYSAIKYNYKNNIILGTSNSTFDPEKKLTRGMLITILHRMEGYPKQNGDSKFSDVQNPGDYYYEAIKWGTAKNIISGYDNGKFGPNDPITREQLGVILSKYSRYKGKYKNLNADLNKFTDGSKVSEFAKTGMKWAIGTGVITGTQDGRINPQGNTTRAEAASMIYKYCMNVK